MNTTSICMISIIIPVYNVALYLRQCVESIINQEGNVEIILVDDGSPDECPAICDEYAKKDRRIKVIHKNNGGVSSARNAGLDIAQGKWIWFVDGDDYISENAISELKNILEKEDNIDLIRFSYKRLIGNEVKKIDIENIDNLQSKEYLQKYHSYLNPTMLFKLEIINNIDLRFSEDIKMGEDLEFQYKYLLFCYHPIQYNIHLYNYRLRELSATKSNNSRYNIINDSLDVLKRLLSFIKERNIQPEKWFYIKVQNIMKNILFSASIVKDLDIKELQYKIRTIMDLYRDNNINSFNTIKMRLAYIDIRLYFILNKVYLKLTGKYRI